MSLLEQARENASNQELIDMVLEKEQKNSSEALEWAIIAAKEFKYALIDERKNYYRQGKLIAIADDYHYYLTTKTCRKAENYFFNLSDKELAIRKSYFYYVNEIEKQGRAIEDIFELEPEKIYEISKLENPERYEEVEQFVLTNGVGVKYLKGMIEIINDNENITLEKALEQAKGEAKAKREEAKAGTKLQQKYKLVRKCYKELLARSRQLYKECAEAKKSYKKLEQTCKKQEEKILDLKEKLKSSEKLKVEHSRFLDNIEHSTDIEPIKPNEGTLPITV